MKVGRPTDSRSPLPAERFLESDMPEQSLCLAIVTQALKDYISPKMLTDEGLIRTARREARVFLTSRETHPWTLRWILDHVCNDPEAALQSIWRWIKDPTNVSVIFQIKRRRTR